MLNVSEMTLGEWQARQIEKSAKILAHFVESTREDKLRWRPSTGEESQSRSVMDLLCECTDANQRWLGYIVGQPMGLRPTEFDRGQTVPEAIAELQESATALADEVRKIQGEGLMREIQTHRGPMPAALAMQFAVRNMTYHMGQINMVQLLYGDTEFHINAEFLTL